MISERSAWTSRSAAFDKWTMYLTDLARSIVETVPADVLLNMNNMTCLHFDHCVPGTMNQIFDEMLCAVKSFPPDWWSESRVLKLGYETSRYTEWHHFTADLPYFKMLDTKIALKKY